MATVRRSRIVEGSCWGCRRRRVKCDLQRPACSRCHDGSQQCDYGPSVPIKWVGGMALRGRNAPTRQPVAPESPLAQRMDEGALMLYFDNAVLPRFQLLEQKLPLDLKMVLQDQCFQRAIIAVSRAHHHLALCRNSSNTALVRKEARYSAIQSLRQRLEANVDSAQSAQQLFTINVLLCMLDGMIEPSVDLNASTCHLRGGIAMLNRWPEIPVDMLAHGGLEAHLLSVFATMDLVHALLSGDKPFFDPLIWHMFSNVQAWWGSLPVTHRFLALLKVYSEMASLGHIVHSCMDTGDGVRLVEKCLSPVEAVLDEQFQLEVFPNGDPFSTTSVSVEKDDFAEAAAWKVFCKAYELSGKIYVLRALRQRAIYDEEVQAATRKGVETLLDARLPGMMAHCVILPILVIGANCIHTQDRQAIAVALQKTASFLAFGNLSLMADLLRTIWAQTDVDSHWWATFATISDKVFIF